MRKPAFLSGLFHFKNQRLRILPFYEFLFDFTEHANLAITFFRWDYSVNITFFNIEQVV